MRAIHCLATVSWIALLGAAVTWAQAAPGNVVGLTVIHRHGARITQPPENVTGICGSLCGQLTTSGVEMLFSLGQQLQRDYPNFAFLDPSFVGDQGNTYNPDRLVSHSTDVDRTLQSSQAMIHGIMAPLGVKAPTLGVKWAPGSVLPVVHTVSNENNQMMLPSETTINLFVRSAVGLNTRQGALQAAYVKTLFTPAEAAEIGALTGLPTTCGAEGDMVSCILSAWDIAACNFANGVAMDPKLVAYYPRLTDMLRFHNKVVFFSYNASDETDRAIGALGFQLGNTIAAAYLAAPEGTSAANPIFTEYSGHDITVMPLTALIGTVNETVATNPEFAAAWVLELVAPAGNATNATIRARYGQPDQTYGSAHQYSFEYAPLQCTNAAGTQYTADALEGCPVADWSSYIQQFAPASPAGQCYMSAKDLGAFDCLPGTSTTDVAEQAPNAACAFWRSKCPLWACRTPGASPATMPNYFLMPNLRCASTGAAA